MKSLQRLLLVPCLAPLLAVLLIAASTPRSTSRIQLLVWNTSPQPIGVWMALAGLAGAGLSGLSALALMPRPPLLKRRLHQPVDAGPWAEAEASPPPRAADPMPERDVRDPAPTVAVPYRVVQRGPSPSPRPSAPKERSIDPRPSRPEAGSDWGDDPDRDW